MKNKNELNLLFEILGLKHLTADDVRLINNKVAISDTKKAQRLFHHLADCRMCKRKVPGLTLEDFRNAYPAKVKDDFIEQQYKYYSEK